MTGIKDDKYICSLIKELIKQSKENEWLEFKHNNKDPKKIGEYISALSNSAALLGRRDAYIIWGVCDDTNKIVGTSFSPSNEKIGNEALENWLLRSLEPKIDFVFYEVKIDEKKVVLLNIAPAYRHPVRFKDIEYIRISSYTKKLKEHPEKERELWKVFDNIPFEKQDAISNLKKDEVLKYLEYETYFRLLDLPIPENIMHILK